MTKDEMAGWHHRLDGHESLCLFNLYAVYIMRNTGNSVRLFWGAPKSLQMVIAAMKLKDAYSLEEKL